MDSLRYLTFYALIACVLGHAVIRTPVPLNPNPTTSRPCGVTTLPANPTPAAQWAVGTTQSVTWDLVANDGGTRTTAAFDLTATGTLNAFAAGTATPVGGTFNVAQKISTFSFTIPDVTATSASGLVLFRMVSNTNWNSCLYVNVTKTVSPAPKAPEPVCKTVTNLALCNMSNSQQVYVAADATPASIDAQTNQVYVANLNLTTVFTNGANADCQALYRNFLCAINLPACPAADGTQPAGFGCLEKCQETMKTCGLTDIHADLYDCTTYPACSKSSPASIMIASLTFVVFALFALVI